MVTDYAEFIGEINRALGIPADYAKSRGLTLQIEAWPHELVIVSAPDAPRPVRLHETTAAAWTRLHTAAARDEITLLPLSGYRSVARQEEIFRRKLGVGQSVEEILLINAAPGYSEHHTGRALDIGTPNDPPCMESFAETTAFHWLKKHAGDFGFHLSYPRVNLHGISYEPWHWCWYG
ncbi:MAG TPA: M15 family metallopeptidase [Opitutaceae bacterium]|nr:M15 family metallopeptidase [Opitutaceae bacterium]